MAKPKTSGGGGGHDGSLVLGRDHGREGEAIMVGEDPPHRSFHVVQIEEERGVRCFLGKRRLVVRADRYEYVNIANRREEVLGLVAVAGQKE